MHVGIKVGAGLVGVVLGGTALGAGGAASAGEQPPPRPAQVKPPHGGEEGHGPGAIKVGAKGAAQAMHRLMVRDELRQRWCHGRVLPSDGLNLREGPGVRYRVVRILKHDSQVTTDWDTVQRRDGYLWVRLPDKFWIADYKTGNGNGKWYIGYSDCH
ncbi:SH3 domain-containing protein [Actinomadura violacea]|uniref:SH3 domain-containing protein n=1 Tax=Actinomadura violacea TaxID=2819934 RepID=A0ABS3S5R0_9ACTN|nr:SH3 domain-containing protein [Actinomadura violacea]MBO2464345.1 SH3 domain-containing protein [Actinomadura violacea]